MTPRHFTPSSRAWRTGLAGLFSLILMHTTAVSAAAAPSQGQALGAEALFWTQAQREADFPHMESHYPARTIARGDKVYPLPQGAPLDAKTTRTLQQFMASQNTAGLLVLQDGKVRLEKYGPDFGPKGRWTSFSVAKSFTSTLVGAAIKDGYIKSLDEPVTRYIHGLRGSAYDGVTIRQLLTMTSGVKWNEDYTDPKSDVARLFSDTPPPGEDATVAYMKKLPREAPPGSKWVYKTGETNLIGVLVREATGKTLSDYLSEKVWRPFGMEQDGVWLIDNLGHEPGGCCLSATMRDYGRFGQFILNGGRIGGRDILPQGWLAAATHKQADIGEPGQGYGYQWWTQDDGTFGGEGIFGQAVHIDPKRRLVVVVLSAWPEADRPERWDAQAKMFSVIAEAIDREAAARR